MSLGDGTAAFRVWRQSDLPTEWQVPLDDGQLQQAANSIGLPASNIQSYIAIELPDYPWAWQYVRWHEQTDHQQVPGDAVILPIVVARPNFRQPCDEEEAREATADCLRGLLHHGRPEPLWTRVWGAKPQTQRRVGG